MSSIARRSIRTTAAAAGIAALGLGFAGPALAAPSVPELPTLDAASVPDAGTVPGLGAFTPAAETSMPALPDAFSFQAPSTDAAQVDPSYMSVFDPTAQMGSLKSLTLPTEMNAASLPGTDGLANLNGTFNGRSVNNDAPAMPSLDTANAFTGLASQAGVPSI
jgi:hypothetical protein